MIDTAYKSKKINKSIPISYDQKTSRHYYFNICQMDFKLKIIRRDKKGPCILIKGNS